MIFDREPNEGPWQRAFKIISHSLVLFLGFSALRTLNNRNSNPVYCTTNATQDFINDAHTTFDYLRANPCNIPDVNFKALREAQPSVLHSFDSHVEIIVTKDGESARFTENLGIGRSIRGNIVDRNHPLITEVKPQDDKTSVYSKLVGKGGEFCQTIYQSVCEPPKGDVKINIPKRSFNM